MHAVFVYDLGSGRIRRLADAGDVPDLAAAEYVHVWPYPGERREPAQPGRGEGLLIWATSVREQDLDLGRLIGPSVRIVDRDGDGVFESIE
jgi:hypothetical protein